jgi:hypothetical protein
MAPGTSQVVRDGRGMPIKVRFRPLLLEIVGHRENLDAGHDLGSPLFAQRPKGTQLAWLSLQNCDLHDLVSYLNAPSRQPFVGCLPCSDGVQLDQPGRISRFDGCRVRRFNSRGELPVKLGLRLRSSPTERLPCWIAAWSRPNSGAANL